MGGPVVVTLVGAKGEISDEGIEGGYGEGDEVESGPDVAAGDEGGGNQRADGAADAVAAMKEAECRGSVDEVGAKDVIEGQIERYS